MSDKVKNEKTTINSNKDDEFITFSFEVDPKSMQIINEEKNKTFMGSATLKSVEEEENEDDRIYLIGGITNYDNKIRYWWLDDLDYEDARIGDTAIVKSSGNIGFELVKIVSKIITNKKEVRKVCSTKIKSISEIFNVSEVPYAGGGEI